MFFYRNPLKWVQDQKLIANDPDGSPGGDNFGYSLSLSPTGDILAVGAYGDEVNGAQVAGSAYIFQGGSEGYQQSQKITINNDNVAFWDAFGWKFSFNFTGDTLVISAFGKNGFAGAAYIFQSSSLGYQQVQKLTASGDANPAGDLFGISISLNSTGDILAIGASGDEENGGASAGSVYIFQSSSLGYQQVQKLTASGDANPAGDGFGNRLAMNSAGDTLAIGAYADEENGGTDAGSVYIFQSSSLGYQQVQKLTASGDADPAGDWFGSSVAMNSAGDTLAIGAQFDEENGGGAGSVYIFQSSSLGYQQVQKLTASGDADPAGDGFGNSVAMNSVGDILAIGAYRDDEGGVRFGSTYIFQSSSIGYEQVQKIMPKPQTVYSMLDFGESISLNSVGDTIAVGSYMDTISGSQQAGSSYIFKYTRDY